MRGWTTASSIFGAAALGALATYLFDPELGRRRRAALRERARRAGHSFSERLREMTRELRGELSSLKRALPPRRAAREEPFS